MGLLALRAMAAEQSSNPLAPRQPAFRPKARRLIHLFMNGGPSHIDSFDPKPELAKYAGKPLPGPRLLTERATGSGFPSPFRFFPRGQSGLPVSDLFPRVAECADLLCVVRSMQSDTPNHEPALMLMNCGEQRQMRPSMGAWLVHGLGTECANLPGFVSLCPGGLPIQEGQNWQNAFLPAACQGTHLDTLADSPNQWIENLANQAVTPRTQRAQLALARKLAALSPNSLPADPRLEGRLGSMELAFRMQWEASDALDLAREDQSTRDLYGDTVQGRQMLLARRLVERGTRVVQVWTGAGQPWDSHDDLEANHRRLANDCDQAIAALLVDLRRRGLLEDTLVLWGGEFGRTPTVELPTPGSNLGRLNGRDHNPYGFSVWLAGGGVRAGTAVGATDDFGFKAIDNPVHVHDLHATILHLMGFDHEKLTFRHAGRDFRLTDVHGHVVPGIIA
ncbi:MAG: DUF1501 domain-containing protein [Planctomycetota bacterium]|nr:DUF1501 domain-containing protein [Planctomycetota bacterium]RLS40572.1 MAG: DUF1501 domain-containing protein [Planctomycetota bacterium]